MSAEVSVCVSVCLCVRERERDVQGVEINCMACLIR